MDTWYSLRGWRRWYWHRRRIFYFILSGRGGEGKTSGKERLLRPMMNILISIAACDQSLSLPRLYNIEPPTWEVFPSSKRKGDKGMWCRVITYIMELFADSKCPQSPPKHRLLSNCFILGNRNEYSAMLFVHSLFCIHASSVQSAALCHPWKACPSLSLFANILFVRPVNPLAPWRLNYIGKYMGLWNYIEILFMKGFNPSFLVEGCRPSPIVKRIRYFLFPIWTGACCAISVPIN